MLKNQNKRLYSFLIDIKSLNVITLDKYLDLLKEGKRVCDNKKAMVGLEYVASNVNLVFGFISLVFVMYIVIHKYI